MVTSRRVVRVCSAGSARVRTRGHSGQCACIPPRGVVRHVSDPAGSVTRVSGHRITRDEVIWAFAPDLRPVLEIDPGETVTLETNDCFTGQIQTELDLVTEIDFERVNSATGPIAVRGAE